MKNNMQIQYQYNGEWFDLWQTDVETLEAAWDEIDADQRPTEGAWVRFEGVDEIMSVNGGFQ